MIWNKQIIITCVKFLVETFKIKKKHKDKIYIYISYNILLPSRVRVFLRTKQKLKNIIFGFFLFLLIILLLLNLFFPPIFLLYISLSFTITSFFLNTLCCYYYCCFSVKSWMNVRFCILRWSLYLLFFKTIIKHTHIW
jgi:hypothetical protein